MTGAPRTRDVAPGRILRSSTHLDQKSVLLIGASIIVLVPFLLWWVLGLKRIFPLAVIQIFTGIALGPTLLGEFAPAL